MKLYFVTTNDVKAAESLAFFAERKVPSEPKIELCLVKHDVQEIMNPNLEAVVKSKALEAYRYLLQPCCVEHGGLFFEALPDLPGPLGRLIWNAVGERMCGFLGDHDSRRASARAVIGYCDGRRISVYKGETRGEVAQSARGEYNKSNWDPIFIPEGSEETYGEMGFEKKRQTSPLIKAWELFLKEGHPTDAGAIEIANQG
ncbi:MAG: non-canonical purine NTP pyrophosphatase [Nitrospirota bacterium]